MFCTTAPNVRMEIDSCMCTYCEVSGEREAVQGKREAVHALLDIANRPNMATWLENEVKDIVLRNAIGVTVVLKEEFVRAWMGRGNCGYATGSYDPAKVEKWTKKSGITLSWHYPTYRWIEFQTSPYVRDSWSTTW